MTSILSETFAPPRIATNGRSGASSAWPRYLSSSSIKKPGGSSPDQVRDALGRRVRPMARPERVVDIEVRVLGQLTGERGVVLLLLRMEPHVLEEHQAVALLLRLLDGEAGRVADAILGEGDRAVR